MQMQFFGIDRMVSTGKKNRSAFTLIELLVVIAIISLLVSILLPSLSKAKALAAKAVCMSNSRSIGLGFNLYLSEYDGNFYHVEPTWFWYNDPKFREWQVALAPYLDGPSEPSDRPDTEDDMGVFHCPEIWVDNPSAGDGFFQFYEYGGSYSINAPLYVKHPDPENSRYRSFQDLEMPDKTSVVCDYFYYTYDNMDVMISWEFQSPWFQGPHVGEMNVLFSDWHVESWDPSMYGPDNLAEWGLRFYGDTWYVLFY